MPDIRTPLVTGEYYHIFNRGVAKLPTFLDRRDYQQAVLDTSYYRFTEPPMKLSRLKELSQEIQDELLKNLQVTNTHVKIVCFVLMPNHFHFLLQQTSENGISIFLSKFTNSYTKYFNTKHERVGPLFQGIFKSVRIEDEEQLIHLSRYIHLNPVVSHVIKEKDLFSYPWSSLPDYMKGDSSLVWMDPILNHFSSIKKYQNFILDQVEYAKILREISHVILEE